MENPAPTPAPEAHFDYIPAGFWIRGGAYTIDSFLVLLGQALLSLLLTFIGLPKALASLLAQLLGISYFVWMPVVNSGQTVGKMAAGIAMMRTDGSPLTYLRCLGRWAGYLLSGLPLGIGFLVAAFTDKKRALHDYITDTRVIYIREVGMGRKLAVILLGLILPMIIFVGLLAAIAIPKFAQLAQKSKEGAVLGNLGTLRSAVAIYYGDNSGKYPTQLVELSQKQLAQIPALQLRDHPAGAEVVAYDASVCDKGQVDPAKIRDTGQWGYVSDPQAPCYGAVFIDCSHANSQGKTWASY
ncbi:MAG TPA: hypothetical protein DEB40_10465 [Elusimicrobia bacterium]|nr:hypothetical protein [Elusimicrobiota bacterium]HBT62152.1 hypothetical protein [Elusimicrobiota bacterium]